VELLRYHEVGYDATGELPRRQAGTPRGAWPDSGAPRVAAATAAGQHSRCAAARTPYCTTVRLVVLHHSTRSYRYYRDMPICYGFIDYRPGADATIFIFADSCCCCC
jgi:hypothetical protein